MFGKRFNILPINVIVIGCGGTGSRVIPWIAQYLATLPSTLSPTLTLIDGDIVEPKNLSRQNFIQEDVGLNKAVVLAERYGEAYGVPVVSIPHFYNQAADVAAGNVNITGAWTAFLSKYMREAGISDDVAYRVTNRPQVIISCVDSVTARLNIVCDIVAEKYLVGAGNWRSHGDESQALTSSVIIDAGNENTYGQVRIYHPAIVNVRNTETPRYHYRAKNFEKSLDLLTDHLYGLAPATPGDMVEVPFIPAPLGSYVASMLTASAADRSCADLDQTMAVNVQMATGIFQMFQNLAMNHPFKHHTWYYDLHNGNSQVRMDKDFLSSFINVKPGEANDYVVTEAPYSAQDSHPRAAAVENGFLKGTSVKLLVEYQHTHEDICGKADYIDRLGANITNSINNGVMTVIPPEILAVIRGTPVKA